MRGEMGMKTKAMWKQLVRGYVRVQIDGVYGERFLNRCIQKNVAIWSIKRMGAERIVCFMDMQDAKKIRPLVKQTECKVTFVERLGYPAFVKKAMNRVGFVGGIGLAIVLMFILSNIVWSIEIKGASPKVEHELRQLVEELGVKRGAFQFTLPSVEDLQREVTEQLSGATWIGVRQNGTTYQFEVVEQQLPEEAERISPRHLVAKKKAIVHSVFVEHGQPKVKVNDYVEKGDMLVSGFIGKEGKEQIVPAVGVVLGEIWYTSDVTIPLESQFSTLTGESVTTHQLSAFGVNLPIWGFKKHEFKEFETFQEQKELYFWKWTLPIQYTRTKVYEANRFEQKLTKGEAVERGKKLAKQELYEKIDKDATIEGEKVLHERVENGKVKLRIHYQVIEDITSEMPIIQGD